LAAELAGSVWEGLVSAADLTAIRARFAVTSAVRRRDGILVRLCGEQAPRGFVNAAPTLEEAYLVRVRADRAA
jgi:hypothetical protein